MCFKQVLEIVYRGQYSSKGRGEAEIIAEELELGSVDTLGDSSSAFAQTTRLLGPPQLGAVVKCDKEVSEMAPTAITLSPHQLRQVSSARISAEILGVVGFDGCVECGKSKSLRGGNKRRQPCGRSVFTVLRRATTDS